MLWWVCSLQACACTRGLGSRVGRRHSAHALALCAAYPARCRRRHRDITVISATGSCTGELCGCTCIRHRTHTSVKNAPPRVFGKRSWAARTDGAGRNARTQECGRLPAAGDWAGGVHRDAARAPGRIQRRGHPTEHTKPLRVQFGRGGGIEPTKVAGHLPHLEVKKSEERGRRGGNCQ